MTQDFESARNEMVEKQLKARGIISEAVLDAMREVPRHLFVPAGLLSSAYDDSPLPLGFGQTISQPYIVAFMTEQLGLTPGMRVLEIGTGSGYQTAILAALGCEVFTIELLEELAKKARKTFATLGLDGIQARQGDGYLGWQEEAPFDAIIVTAAPESIPETLIEQLKDGGRMIVPVGGIYTTQSLMLLTKSEGTINTQDLLPVRFVPLVKPPVLS